MQVKQFFMYLQNIIEFRARTKRGQFIHVYDFIDFTNMS